MNNQTQKKREISSFLTLFIRLVLPGMFLLGAMPFAVTLKR